jgi:hypothetical protein
MCGNRVSEESIWLGAFCDERVCSGWRAVCQQSCRSGWGVCGCVICVEVCAEGVFVGVVLHRCSAG